VNRLNQSSLQSIKMIIDHVSSAVVTANQDTPHFSLQLEAPGRKTLAVHELLLRQVWSYPDEINEVDLNERLSLNSSQAMHLIVDVGESLFFESVLQYGNLGVATLSVSGHYAEGQ